MVRRKICATFFGGYRTSVSGFSDKSIGVCLHFCQVLIYLIAPLTIFLSVTMISNEDERIIAALMSGALQAVLINLPIMIASYSILRSDEGDEDDEDISCASKAGLRFLFPPKSSVFEIFVCFLLTFANGALMTFALHPATLTYFFGESSTTGFLVSGLIVSGLSSSCLFSAHCPESAIYRDNDIYFGFGSNHYQRVVSNILIALTIVLIEAFEMSLTQKIAGLVYWMFLIVYVLQAFGVLSHPVVTILWAMEQASEHLFGSTARASDSRIVMYFVLNVGFIALSAVLGGKSQISLRLCTALLSFLASHNLFGSLGMKKAFRGENSLLQQKKALANIVFAGKEGVKSKDNSSKDMIMTVVYSLFLMGISALFAAIIQPRNDSNDEDNDLTAPLVIVSVALMVIQWGLSNMTRVSLWRIIPCPHSSADKGFIVEVASKILKIILIAVLIITVFQLPTPVADDKNKFDAAYVLQVALMYRALAKAFHNPLAASLDSIVLLAYPNLEALTLAAFTINRTFILARKLQYVGVSFATAQSNSKQRFANQEIVFAIQFTILLPITLSVIVITALLDTATVPFLGFAFFIIGYPKPLRGWSEVNPAEANPNDPRSDGHLYQAMMPQLSAELQRLITADPFNFERGSYYFLKNEKMILLVQVLERGTNYVVITVKGTELQETTVCHAEENGRINDETEALFDRKQREANFQFSLSPLKQLKFGVYDDVKVSLAGIIENPAFADLVKQAFMRIILLKVRDSFKSRPSAKLIKVFSKDFGDQETAPGRSLLESNWLAFLDVNFSLMQFEADMAAVAGSSGQSFNNRVHPARQFTTQPQRVSREQAFLSSLEGHGASNRQPREERKVNITQNQGISAVPQPGTQSAVPVPGSNRPKVKAEPTHMRPMDDLDDMLNDLEDLEGGEQTQHEGGDSDLDDLDDLLNDIAAPTKPQPQRSRITSIRKNIDDAHTRTSNNGGGLHQEILDDWDPQVLADSRQPPNQPPPDRRLSHSTQKSRDLQQRSQVSQKPQIDNRANPRAQSGSGDLEMFAFQSFYLLFGDDYSNMPQKLMKIFKGDLKKEFGNKDFLESKDINAIHLKHLILLSARIAFHWSFEAFIMGELELSENPQFIDEVYKIDKEWYLGSEEYLWNSAIERNLPNMERLIQKEGQYFAHQLKFGENKDSIFSVFEFRREVIRGIWANVNMELLYYINSNDERFSIQAEKNILRNLLVQLAEIPLGYPVYSSGARTINY